jgi:putative redox protein
MMTQEMSAHARLGVGMQFEVQAGSGHQVTLDAAREDGGMDAGFRPMELLLVGLAGCTGMDVISILRKKRQAVTGYEVLMHGVRADEHPMVFTTITVEHVVRGHHVDPRAVQRAIKLSQSHHCGAGAMLGKTAYFTHTFHLVEEPAEVVASA